MRARGGFIVICGILGIGLAVGGAELGRRFLQSAQPLDLLSSLARWDGQAYERIASEGYDYRPDRGSSVAFFPAYPLAASCLRRVAHVSAVAALVVVSNVCFLLAIVTMACCLRSRGARALDPTCGRNGNNSTRAGEYALLAMAVMPTTFFSHMAYSESMFLLVSILALHALSRRWPLTVIAAIVGLATAVRPVGIGLLAPFGLHVWMESRSNADAARRLAILMPVACWGLLGYMAFQYREFGEPLAFALTQEYWRICPPGTFGNKALSLLSWQPAWNVYVPGSRGYWRTLENGTSPVFNLQFANPICFIGTAVLIALGGRKRWLTADEVLTSAAFLVIPYLTRAHEMCMASQGRFAAVVFPVYIVVGELLARAGTLVAVAVLAAAGFLMAAYAAQFAAGYPLI